MPPPRLVACGLGHRSCWIRCKVLLRSLRPLRAPGGFLEGNRGQTHPNPPNRGHNVAVNMLKKTEQCFSFIMRSQAKFCIMGGLLVLQGPRAFHEVAPKSPFCLAASP